MHSIKKSTEVAMSLLADQHTTLTADKNCKAESTDVGRNKREEEAKKPFFASRDQNIIVDFVKVVAFEAIVNVTHQFDNVLRCHDKFCQERVQLVLFIVLSGYLVDSLQ